MSQRRVLHVIFLITILSFAKGNEIPTEDQDHNHAHDDLPFFRRIQQLNLDWEDIVGLYRNVSAEVETELCKNKCKTAIAFWVLQSLKPCDTIEKADCPKGLLCCTYAGELDEVKYGPTQNPKDAEHGFSIPEKIPLAHSAEDESHHWLDPEPVLDPIPDEEPQKFESTELNTS
ncbi:unnamed protein product [Allacma fusca]|uniref:Uncharacterized protein n=1 Tax=Allacma fusca TaxID=39272 RepID=A0A8J2PKM8_9HEXA|nr:unnamed protein product [Allacma fusca]